ncbi:translation initiation factor IF-2 [Candidatus Saganbacteria bacterium]|nr:translation initiation factor IF-2 [Candidatus Saganbacteria bacterium]
MTPPKKTTTSKKTASKKPETDVKTAKPAKAKKAPVVKKARVKATKEVVAESKKSTPKSEKKSEVIKPLPPPPPRKEPPLPSPVPVPVPSPKPLSPPKPLEPKPELKINIDTENISVKELADKISAKPSEVIKELMKRGQLANINQRISSAIAQEIAASLGKIVVIQKKETVKEERPRIQIDKLVLRPPIVTIMGHVDHGKTKLLDAIRKTRVAEGEAGGITQHIGAYQVVINGKKVTFLDTPGHEAFTALRARGAKVTDIAVLVVAADDGVKPQTIEAIDHAKAAGVPIIVAINKIDKPDSNLDRVKQQLSELGLQPEDWGGKTVMVPTSARQGQGISELLEMILLVAELQELKADPDGIPVGIVIEAKLDKGKGPVADVLVQSGTLRVGDIFAVGHVFGRVKALFNEHGDRLSEAGPATPVEVLGASAVPTAGDMLQVLPTEKEAKQIAEQRQELQTRVSRGKVLSLEDFSKHVKAGEQKTLNLVVKADVQGSLEAIKQSLQDMTVGNIKLNIIHRGAGTVTESDVMLAKASAAIIAGFNVGMEENAEVLAAKEGVEVRHYNIIYKLIDDVKLAMEGLLEPEYEEVVIGHATVRNLFKFSKIGVIAGCFVKDGKLVRGSKIRVFRGQEKIYDGKLESLKRFKDDVKSVDQNYECGIAILGFTNFQAGDEIEDYEMREKPRQR